VSDSAHRQRATEPTSLKEVLHTLDKAGEFKAVVLASADGLLIGTVSTDYDSDVIAAIVAMLRMVSAETRQQLGMAEVDEITIRSRDRLRLVCRYIITAGENLILVVIAPFDQCYRRATNRAIRQIKRLLS